MTPSLKRVTIEFEWTGTGENRPFTTLRYDFPYPDLPLAKFVANPHPIRASYELIVKNPIARPIITETIETEGRRDNV